MEKKPKAMFFKKIFTKTKKLLDAEKEAQELIKKKKNKSVKPSGFIARKLGVATFWLLFGFMFLVVLITMFNGDTSKAKNEDAVVVKKNYAASAEAIGYAENFTKYYLSWKVDNQAIEDRKKVLAKFLAPGLDQNAGLDFNGLEWNSQFFGVELKKVEEKGENLAHITFLVHSAFYKGEGDERVVEQTQKYIVVPVAYDGNTFGIYELPKYTFIYEETTLKEVKNTKLKQADVTETSEMKNFLTTFFKSYAEDSKDHLNYVLTSDKVASGLNKSMLFKEVNTSSFFKGEKENTFIVFAEVTLIDPLTQVPLKSNYQLSIVKKEGKYLVSGIDDQGNKEIITKGPEDFIKDEEEITEENQAQEEVINNTEQPTK